MYCLTVVWVRSPGWQPISLPWVLEDWNQETRGLLPRGLGKNLFLGTPWWVGIIQFLADIGVTICFFAGCPLGAALRPWRSISAPWTWVPRFQNQQQNLHEPVCLPLCYISLPLLLLISDFLCLWRILQLDWTQLDTPGYSPFFFFLKIDNLNYICKLPLAM